MRGFAVLFLAAGAATGSAAGGDKTITKVVKLLQGMLDKSKVDGKADQDAYATFKCYCDKTTEEKNEAVTAAAAEIERMQAFLADKRAENAKLSQEVFDLKKSMDANEQTRAEMLQIRNTENAAFLADESDMVTGIDQLDRAIGLLSAIGADQTEPVDGLTNADNSQLLAADATAAAGGFIAKTSSVAKTTVKVQDLSSAMKDALNAASLLLNPKQRTQVAAFLQAPGNYNAQSGEIVGILKSMNDTFTANLENARTEETKKQTEYDTLNGNLETEFSEMETSYNSKKDIIGDNADDIASTETELETTQTIQTEAQDFLASLETRCATKEKEFTKRKTLRANEEAAIAQAIAILHSDDARDTFGKVDATSTGATSALVAKKALLSKVAPSFLQLSAKPAKPHTVKMAIGALIDQARALHSKRLARVATSLAAENPFEKVLDQIRKMIALIDEEEEADVQKKGWCEETQSEQNANLADKVTDLGTLDTNIANLGIALETSKTNIETATEDLQDNRDSQTTETETRKAENVQFRTNLANLQEASKILKKATEVLKKYYEYLHAATGAHSYTVHAKTDSGGQQIKRVAGKTPEELQAICSDMPECVGFNTAGWLKSSLAPEEEWYDWEGGDLYVKTFDQASGLSALQEEPLEGEPGTWDGETEGQKSQGHDVIAMLEYIAEQTKLETDDAIGDERSSQAQYETNMRALTADEQSLQDAILSYESVKAEKEKTLEQAHEDKAATQREHDSIENYLAQIEPHCNFYITNYQTRTQNRAAEKTALEGAITTLEGTPAFNAAVAAQESEDLGKCSEICNGSKDTATAECQACQKGVTVAGYCAQKDDNYSGCADATATGSAAEMNAPSM